MSTNNQLTHYHPINYTAHDGKERRCKLESTDKNRFRCRTDTVTKTNGNQSAISVIDTVDEINHRQIHGEQHR